MSILKLIKGGAAAAPTPAAPQTNITEQHKRSFKMLLDPVMRGTSAEVALASCFVNGEPTAAIVEIAQLPDQRFLITPIWCARDLSPW